MDETIATTVALVLHKVLLYRNSVMANDYKLK
jgi:hypothetical protein